jgi:hypothetical protein
VQRTQQAQVVHQFVDDLLAVDADANVVVVGDLNDFQFSAPIQTLAGDVLQNLIDLLPEGDRYTYLFEGNLQALDHILVSQHPLFEGDAEYDIVHTNVGFPDAVSDHDPVLTRFVIPKAVTDTPDAETPDAETELDDGLDDDSESDSSAESNSSLFISILPTESGRSLIEQVAIAYAPKDSLGYNTGRDILYSQIDSVDGVLEGVYTGYQIRLNPNARPRSDAFAKGINAEHTWPQSKGAKGWAKSDLHHLFPTRIRVNSTRGNNPFADIPDDQTDRWFRDREEIRSIPVSAIDDYSEFDPGFFEPRESKKGDVARAMFYFNTVYEAQANEVDASFFPSQLATLCLWDRLDPPDEREVQRSHAIAQTAQGNENPFVLDPTLVERTYCP